MTRDKLTKWNDSLVKALAIVDEKGRGDGHGSRMLWERDWSFLRELLLETVDDVKVQRALTQ